ncbi:MAG: dienelactone hydrolase family protein [Microthrixaceae bacterium]
MSDEPDAPTSLPAAGSAYLVHPEGGPGRGVLMLPSWRGLCHQAKAAANSLADAGFTVLVPDFFGGVVPADDAAGEALLAELDPNVAAGLVVSSVVALRAHSCDPDAPVGAVGFSSGGSFALWAATRNPDSVAAVVTYYGAQDIDFASLTAPVLGHFAEFDDLCTEDQRNEMAAHLLLLERDIDFHVYDGTWHFFAEDIDPSPAAAAAAARAWDRTVEFLRRHLADKR